MGRAASGVRGIRLAAGDQVVGLVVADPEATLLTACANGYGKRTTFGPGGDEAEDGGLPQGEGGGLSQGEDGGLSQFSSDENGTVPLAAGGESGPIAPAAGDAARRAGLADDEDAQGEDDARSDDDIEAEAEAEGEEEAGEEGDELSSQRSYRTQHRGGKGLRDIKTEPRNGPVIGIVRVSDGDELLMMTARGKIQRIPASDVSIIGRNTQGVRIMSLEEGDTLVAVKRVPREDADERGKEESA